MRPEDIDAFVVVPLYGFVSRASRLDLAPDAFLSRFHDAMFEEVLAPSSELRHYMNVFRPDYVLRVNEPFEVGSFPSPETVMNSEAISSLVSKLFGKSITTALQLLTCLRLYSKGLLQRGDIWIIWTLQDHTPPGQLCVRFSPTGIVGLAWAGGEGMPHPVATHERYRFEAEDIPYFRAFWRRVGAVISSRSQLSLPKNIPLALSYYNRTFGAAQKAMRLVDLVTCLECLLVDGNEEISYRLASRCANLLGPDPDARKRLYQEIRGFYNVRSRLVHGEILKEKHESYIQTVEDLRDCVRRVLLALLGLIVAGEQGADVYATLDEMGLDDNTRTSVQLKASQLLHLDMQSPDGD